MNINNLLKFYKTLYVNFEPAEEESLKKRLKSLGFDVPEKLRSPVKVHRDRTVSFITGFNEGMLYSSSFQFKKLRPDCLKIEYKKLSDKEISSAWYKSRE